MASFRAAEAALIVLLSSLCSVSGFAPPPLGNTAANVDRYVRTSCCTSSTSLRDCTRRSERGMSMLQAEAGAGGDDSIEEYKKEMAEFMAQAHEKRLQAMEAVKAEVQRGYEEQIAELQGKLSALPATTSVDSSVSAPVPTLEPVLVGAAAAGASREPVSPPHPAYAARAARPGWEARWGSEEAERASTISASGVTSVSAGVSEVPPVLASVHPAYAARSSRPGWEARWGDEESARVGGVASVGAAGVQVDVHPAYAARAQRPGWEARWGSEEPARVAATPTTSAVASEAGAPGATAPADAHPSYLARMQRPGWEARWGDEEADRVAGAPAGAVAVAGAAAGFATAGGLDKTTNDATDAGRTAVSKSDDPLADEYLPNDVESLKSMVVSLRGHFQDYLLRSLEASNELKVAKTRVDAELSSAVATLTAEQELRFSLQESYLGYMSRSGDNGANSKALVSELEVQVAKLTVEAAELQRFAQDYMVKASSEKLKAVEEATATARVQTELRIAALQAQILELQAGA